jgi:hypothetical protein
MEWSKTINQKSFTSTSLSSKEMHPSTTKLEDQCVTMTAASATTPSLFTTSILMVAGLQKIEKRILGHPARKESEDFRPQIKSVQPKRGHAKLRPQ